MNDDRSLQARWRLETIDEIGSTNDALIARAEGGEPGGVGLLAFRQLNGRGRRGRRWIEPAVGNLAFSVLLRPSSPAVEHASTVFVAALALHDALSPIVAAGSRLLLKWPNDVLIARADGTSGKVGGILVETGVAATGALDWLVIGFGANLKVAPAIVGAAALDGAPEPPLAVARRLLVALDHWRAVRDHSGFAPVRLAWLDRAQPRGTALVVEERGVERRGRFAGLDVDGALLLDTERGMMRVPHGLVLAAERV